MQAAAELFVVCFAGFCMGYGLGSALACRIKV